MRLNNSISERCTATRPKQYSPFAQRESEDTLDTLLVDLTTAAGASSTDMSASASVLVVPVVVVATSTLPSAALLEPNAPLTASRIVSSNSLARRRMTGGTG